MLDFEVDVGPPSDNDRGGWDGREVKFSLSSDCGGVTVKDGKETSVGTESTFFA
jgi:hypothetical protein